MSHADALGALQLLSSVWSDGAEHDLGLLELLQVS